MRLFNRPLKGCDYKSHPLFYENQYECSLSYYISVFLYFSNAIFLSFIPSFEIKVLLLRCKI